jgi:hypothetical protein
MHEALILQENKNQRVPDMAFQRRHLNFNLILTVLLLQSH